MKRSQVLSHIPFFAPLSMDTSLAIIFFKKSVYVKLSRETLFPFFFVPLLLIKKTKILENSMNHVVARKDVILVVCDRLSKDGTLCSYDERNIGGGN